MRKKLIEKLNRKTREIYQDILDYLEVPEKERSKEPEPRYREKFYKLEDGSIRRNSDNGIYSQIIKVIVEYSENKGHPGNYSMITTVKITNLDPSFKISFGLGWKVVEKRKFLGVIPYYTFLDNPEFSKKFLSKFSKKIITKL